MKNSVNNYFIPVLFIMLLAACTQDKSNIESLQNSEVTLRSTQAECDQIENSLPPFTTPLPCGGIADLFECRLNQGIDEDEISKDCNQLGSTLNLSICLNPFDLSPDFTQLVDSIKSSVLSTVGLCPNSCFNPDPLTGCASIIFKVTSVSAAGCNPEECSINYQAKVCCK